MTFRATALAIAVAAAAMGVGGGIVATQVFADARSVPLRVVLHTWYWGTAGLLAVGALWIGVRLPLWGPHRNLAIAVHLVTSMACSLLHAALVAAVSASLRAWWTGTLADGAPLALTTPSRLQFEWGLTLYWAALALAHLIVQAQHSGTSQVQVALAESELLQARLRALEHQIRPHFLFNTFHAIVSVMHRDVGAATSIVEGLSHLLRSSLGSNSGGMSTVRRELELAGHYVTIEKLGRGDNVEVVIDVAEDVQEIELPELVLQPLVENAFRHGCVAGGRIAIAVRSVGPWLEIDVVDSGLARADDDGESAPGCGVALANIQRRLQLLYGPDHAFVVERQPHGGVKAHLRVPVRPRTPDTAGMTPAFGSPHRMWLPHP